MKSNCAERAVQQLMNPRELAAYLHCHTSTVYHLVRLQRISYLKVSHMLRFELPAIRRWVAELERR